LDSSTLQRRDRERLAALFAATYDRSRVESLLPRLRTARPPTRTVGPAEWAGEGVCFATWRLPPAPGRRGLALAVKIAHADWLEGREIARKAWVEAATRLRRAAAPLIPPYEIIVHHDGLALVMPFGEAPLSNAATHWQPLDESLQACGVALRRLDLSLGDVAQGRCWEGIPFLYDLSDLGVVADPRASSVSLGRP
jgi:hypothetical protein